MRMYKFLIPLLLGMCACVSLQAQVMPLQHPWQGKRVALLGDSISDPNGPKYWGHPIYYSYLEEWLGMEVYDYAVSGREWDDVPRQVAKLEQEHGADVDAILILMGTNDYNMGVPIGEWYEESMGEVEASVGEPKQFYKRLHRTFLFDESTFKGRISIAVRLLKETFPGTPITFLTPIHRALFDLGDHNYQPEETWQNRGGLYLDAYVDAIKEVAHVWSVNVIDLHAVSGFFPILDSDAALFYKDTAIDRLHPNDAGHKRLAEVILYQALVVPCR